jgi:hypothetical protein
VNGPLVNTDFSDECTEISHGGRKLDEFLPVAAGSLELVEFGRRSVFLPLPTSVRFEAEEIAHRISNSSRGFVEAS